MKHSSTAPLSAKMQREVLTMLSSGASESDIGEVVSKYCLGIRRSDYPIEDLSYRTRLRKQIEPNETTPHRPDKHYPKIAGGYAKAARYYNWHLVTDEPFKTGESVYWTYITDTPDGYPQTNVIAFRDAGELEGFVFDTEMIITKMLRDKLRLVYDVLDWDLKAVTDEFKPKGYW